MTDYVFEGERIKINAKDYNRMLILYPKIDLVAELQQLDFELREATNKSWFCTMNAKLNYRNKLAKNGKQHQRPARESLAERTQRQTDAALADIQAREDHGSVVVKDERHIWPQVGLENGVCSASARRRPGEKRELEKARLHEGVFTVVPEDSGSD